MFLPVITHLWCLFLFRLFIHWAIPNAIDYRTFGADFITKKYRRCINY